MTGPLDGVQVVELTRNDTVSYSTMILGDLGADVIRVEEVGGGRSARGSKETARAGSVRLPHLDAFSRNKRAIGLNLKHPEAQQALLALCRRSDVLIEGFRPGVTERLGCDYPIVHEANPRLVYCSLSGYGQDGPYRSLPAHDLNITAFSGALASMMPPEGLHPALPMSNLVGDYGGGGMLAVIAIQAALLARDRVGGQYVDVSMFDGALTLMAFASSNFARHAPWPGLRGLAYYNLYQCKDGKYLSLCCLEPWLWENFCRAIARPDFIISQQDAQKQSEVEAHLRTMFLEKSRDQWFDRFFGKGFDIAIGKVLDMDEVFDDPQVQHRQMKAHVGDHDGEPVYQLGIGPKFSATPGTIRRLGPTPGQHTDEILTGLGYTKAQITKLRSELIVG